MGKRKISKPQARSIRRSYAIKSSQEKSSSKEDTDTIVKFIIGVPGAGMILLYFFFATQSGWFLIGVIIAAILEGILALQVITRKYNKISKTFT